MAVNIQLLTAEAFLNKRAVSCFTYKPLVIDGFLVKNVSNCNIFHLSKNAPPRVYFLDCQLSPRFYNTGKSRRFLVRADLFQHTSPPQCCFCCQNFQFFKKNWYRKCRFFPVLDPYFVFFFSVVELCSFF